MDVGTLNFLWAQTLVAGFAAAGVRHVVISPGSRSTPLALAMLRDPRLQTHIVLDERSAAFFALGLAKADGWPAIVVATSGSAPANWLPAVLEAERASVPLLLLSADRPPELHGCGANQTTEQLDLFGSHVRARHALATPYADFAPASLLALAARACEQSRWPHPGPVHLNQPFREPLVPQADTPQAPVASETPRSTPPLAQPDRQSITALATAISGRPGLIVCGEFPPLPGLPETIAALAAHLDCPVLAEPLANLRFGRHDKTRLLVRYNRWLGDARIDAKLSGEWVLRLGAFPVTRQLQQYLSRPRSVAALIDAYPRWLDPAAQLTHLLHADPLLACQALLAAAPAPCPNGWQQQFAGLEAEAAATAEASFIPAILEALTADTPLFIGNSLIIRQFDSLSGCLDKPLPVFGNRGVSGIDGNISTAAGLAAAHGRAVALIGDLTAQHDLGGLALAREQNLVLIVINNSGGGIFDLLPQKQLAEFERAWRTPQHLDFAHAAAAFGIPHHPAHNAAALAEHLQRCQQAGGPHLIEYLTH